MAAVAGFGGLPKRCSYNDNTVMRKTVGTGGLVHGTLGAQKTDGTIIAPASGAVPRGRVLVSDCVSALAGEYCDIEEGCFAYATHGTAITIADVGSIAYAYDNATVSISSSDGEPLGVIRDVDAEGVWVISGLGIGTLTGGV